MKNYQARIGFTILTLFSIHSLSAQTVPFDFLNANFGVGKTIEWQTSNYANGYGHKIYNQDPGAGGITLLNFAARNNSASWTDAMSITSAGRVGIGTTTPQVKLHVEGSTYLFGDVTTTASTWIFNNNSVNNSTIWLTKPTSGPGAVGHYYIKAYDYWGAFLHFQGTGDGGNERLNVTFDGKVGVGTESPNASFHVKSESIDESSTNDTEANLLVEGSGPRDLNTGAVLGFNLPANIDGTNPWQQGRILVTPDNMNNGNASGRMYLQARYFNGTAWDWRHNLVLVSNGRVGIGTETPSQALDVNGSIAVEGQEVLNTDVNNILIGDLAGGDGLRSLTLRAGDQDRVQVTNDGNVGIGTTTPTEKLEVNGTIRSKEVKVEASPWPDYVFADNYQLTTLKELEKFIKSEGHLPEVPSAKEVEENGISLGEMNALLLKKIEELTLYMIEMKRENEIMKLRIENLEN